MKLAFVLDGKEWPMTEHNAEVLKEYHQSLDESVLKKLSGVILDFGEEDKDE